MGKEKNLLAKKPFEETKRIVLNTKGTKDKEGHEVSEEIKEMLSFMDGKTPKTEYAKMLDAAVHEIRQSEERRREYMSINAERADDKELGRFSGYVNSVRDSQYSDDILINVLKIDGNTLVPVTVNKV